MLPPLIMLLSTGLLVIITNSPRIPQASELNPVRSSSREPLPEEASELWGERGGACSEDSEKLRGFCLPDRSSWNRWDNYQLIYAVLCFHILCQTNCSKFPAHTNLIILHDKIVLECETVISYVYTETSSQSLTSNNIFLLKMLFCC
jgi:hypothetical protein